METILLTYHSVTLFLGGFIALASAFLVYISGQDQAENKSWLVVNLFSAIWSFGYFSLITASSENLAAMSNLVLHFAANLIPLFYLLFILTLTKTYRERRYVFYGTSILALFFTILTPTSLYVQDVIPKFVFNYAPDAGPLYILFTIYFFAVVIYTLTILWKAYTKEQNKKERERLKYVFFYSLAGFSGGGSVFFLTFNINIPPYPVILFSLYPFITTYAILRHSLFRIKLAATQLFVAVLWIFLATRFVLVDDFTYKVMDGLSLVLAVIIGVFLIKSVLKEIEAREKQEQLSEDLKRVNTKLKEADHMKIQFLSIASHQFRSPLTAIKGYTSLILEGSYGEVPKTLREPIERILSSINNLAVVVDDFLNLSRLEQGQMKYEFELMDIRKFIGDAVEEQRQVAEQKGLKLTYTFDKEEDYTVHIDSGKMKQVITNLIDNAIKYTKEGSVMVALERTDGKILFSVKDTGVGIPKESINSLFEEFSRISNASKVNVSGTGLGLYIARKMVEAHKGRIWAESDGKGKGSQFFVELEAVKPSTKQVTSDF